MNTLLLLRHGENRANLTRFLHRRVDYPLTPKGKLQAEQTAAYLQGFPVTQVFTSPLLRARETAEIIAKALEAPVNVIDRELLHRIEHHNCAVGELRVRASLDEGVLNLVRWATTHYGEAADFVAKTPLEGDL